MSIFDELLGIKSYRLNKAEMAVLRSRLSLAECNAHRDAMERRLASYRVEALELERGWYRELCARIVKLPDIEDVQLSVQDLRQTERKHEEELETSEKARQRAQETLKMDVDHLQVATRMKEKFVELAESYAEEVGRESERKEDLEMEEVASIARERNEWGADSDE